MNTFVMSQTCTPKARNIRVDDTHDVVITRTDEGVVVDVFQLPYSLGPEAEDADATCYSFDKEIE